jgi:hypothetical protein
VSRIGLSSCGYIRIHVIQSGADDYRAPKEVYFNLGRKRRCSQAQPLIIVGHYTYDLRLDLEKTLYVNTPVFQSSSVVCRHSAVASAGTDPMAFPRRKIRTVPCGTARHSAPGGHRQSRHRASGRTDEQCADIIQAY